MGKFNRWVIHYHFTQAERVSTCGGMDSEPTGRRLTHNNSWSCIAPSADIARAVFVEKHPKDWVIDACLAGGTVDCVVTL
jgi:hypothetical protein